jgi:antitoxin VapB
MDEVDTRSFKSGNSVAVRFPRALGLSADVPLKISREGDSYRVTPRTDPEDGKRRLAELIAAIRALPPGGEFRERPEIELPERAGWS